GAVRGSLGGWRDAQGAVGVFDRVADGEPVERVEGFLRLVADEGTVAGDVVVEPVLLDLHDGSHPRLIAASVGWAGAEGLGDVAGRVLHGAGGLFSEPAVEDVVD